MSHLAFPGFLIIWVYYVTLSLSGFPWLKNLSVHLNSPSAINMPPTMWIMPKRPIPKEFFKSDPSHLVILFMNSVYQWHAMHPTCSLNLKNAPQKKKIKIVRLKTLSKLFWIQFLGKMNDILPRICRGIFLPFVSFFLP